VRCARSRWRADGAPLVTVAGPSADGLKDPTRWLTYGGDYSSTRHSPLTQITPENVNQLTAQWTFQTGTTAAFRRRRSSSTACCM
jgi:glucose dehydrogenase